MTDNDTLSYQKSKKQLEKTKQKIELQKEVAAFPTDDFSADNILKLKKLRKTCMDNDADCTPLDEMLNKYDTLLAEAEKGHEAEKETQTPASDEKNNQPNNVKQFGDKYALPNQDGNMEIAATYKFHEKGNTGKLHFPGTSLTPENVAKISRFAAQKNPERNINITFNEELKKLPSFSKLKEVAAMELLSSGNAISGDIPSNPKFYEEAHQKYLKSTDNKITSENAEAKWTQLTKNIPHRFIHPIREHDVHKIHAQNR